MIFGTPMHCESCAEQMGTPLALGHPKVAPVLSTAFGGLSYDRRSTYIVFFPLFISVIDTVRRRNVLSRPTETICASRPPLNFLGWLCACVGNARIRESDAKST